VAAVKVRRQINMLAFVKPQQVGRPTQVAVLAGLLIITPPADQLAEVLAL
jgi:hypothetical protein